MKQLVIILFILGLGTLTSYWSITSENMAKSFAGSGLPGEAAPPAKASGKLLIMSDIHFFPFYDTTIFKALCQSDYTKWQSIFESSANTSYGHYHQDAYYLLLKSTLSEMNARNKHPDMIIINGDFLCHEFESYYYSASKGTNKDSMELFIRKTISFVFLMIKEHFPDTPVLPVLGNNDDYCGDYHVQPSGPFLKFFAPKSQALLSHVSSKDFIQTFSKGGYYQASMPWDSNQVFIGINSVFFSTSYSDACNPSDIANPGNEQMQWLKQRLAACAAKGKKVWLSCHIPPGINVYPSAGGQGPCVNIIQTMWKSSYNEQYLALVNQYSKTIVAGMAGHTHMDDFRLLGTDKAVTSFIHITPAVSPIFYNNPAFQEVTWDPASMKLINSVTYRFNGIETTGNNTWTEEYNYAGTYGVASLDAQSLSGVWEKIGKDSVVRSYYLKYYYVGSSSKPSPWKAYWCGIRNQTPKTFTTCTCK